MLHNLKWRNLGSNQIDEVSPSIGRRSHLETLILSRNQIAVLDAEQRKLIMLKKLKKLYLWDNQLDVEGIPQGIGKLVFLEVI